MEQAKILLVDDQPANLEVLEKALVKNHYTITKVYSGQQALELSTIDQFALIILDVQMPEMDGFQTATKLRERESTKHIPIIFITAIHLDEENIFRGYQTGAVDYLTKPIRLDILRSKVNVFVKLYQQKKQLEKANDQLQQANQNLTQANQELKSTRSQLIQSAKMALLGELETSVVHELNQPLFSISLHAEHLLTHLEKKKFEQLQPGLEEILSQVERASAIIEHLRVFGREASTLEHGLANINEIAENALLLVNKQLTTNGVQVIKEFSDSLPAIHCNAIQMEQVISNLLVNANDAMQDVSSKKITIISRHHNNQTILEIQDTGIGIPEANLDRVFHPFFTTKAPGKGMGLGLPISYNIIETHHGQLKVFSKEGHGTTFCIELPAAE